MAPLNIGPPMSPGYHPLLIVRGATFDASTMDFTWKVDGAAVDLTNAIIRARARTPNGTTLFDLSTATGGVVVSAGRISLRLSASETAAIWYADPPRMRAQGQVQYHQVGTWELVVEMSATSTTVLLTGPVGATQGVFP